VRTLRPIEKGEEILVKYGAEYWRYEESHRRNDQLPRHRKSRRVKALAHVTTVTSSLTDDIRAAAAADTKYAARLVVPPARTTSKDGLLWTETGRLIVPANDDLRTALMAECHDATTGAHFGRDKTMEAMKSRFQWDGMASMVERYVATCDQCQRNKPSQQLTPGLLMPLALPEYIGQSWTTDAVTGLPKTKKGNDAIQLYVERACKLKHFVASRSTDGAAELAAHFRHAVVRAHGVPETIDHQDDWDEYLDMLELGFNSATQASTNRSAFELLHGTKPRLPIDVPLDSAPRVPAAYDRAKRIQSAFEYAHGRLLDAQDHQARNANRHRRAAALAVGDLVLLSTEGLTLRNFTNKLCARYVGPFAVTAVVNANAYTLALPPQLQALHPTFNIEKLKAYRDGRVAFPTRPQQFSRPPPDAVADSNGDEQWDVERVLACRFKGRRKQYLVQWRGYPPEENTWEPRSSLVPFAADALADFESSQLASGG
jgi:Integrase zinc binding domain/Chromo (CHRromatin Organisation MOdifier) domain